jgi:uncharacterized membrane-anchored protein
MEKAAQHEGGLQEPLVDQILDEMWSSLKDRDEFSPAALQELKNLARRGELRKAAEVAKVIKSAGGHNETART